MTVSIRFAGINDRKNHIGNKEDVRMICARPIAGIPNVYLLAPQEEDLWAYKAGKMSEEQFIANLNKKLEEYMPRIERKFLKYKDGTEHTYCCFCRPGKFCHRQIIFKLFVALNEKHQCGYTIDCF